MNRLAVVSLFLLSIIFAGCDPYKVDELLLQKEGVSLVIRGEVVFDYDGNRCQIDRKSVV